MGEDGSQAPHPQLGCLLHHVVEARVLQGREEIVDIGRQRHIGDVAFAAQSRLPFRHGSQMRQPFAVPGVEHANRIAGGQAQDIHQIVALVVRQLDLAMPRQVAIEEKARRWLHGRDRPSGLAAESCARLTCWHTGILPKVLTLLGPVR